MFVLAPFADVCRRSLTTAVTGEFRGIDNYKQVFENKAFWLAAGNTAKFVLVCLPLLIGLGLIIACFLSRFTRIHFLKSAFLFPMAVPAATVVLVWKLIFDRQGFLNLFLTRLGEAAYSAGVLQSAPVFDIDYMGDGRGFLGAGVQLHMEKSRVYGSAVAYGNPVHFHADTGSGQG